MPDFFLLIAAVVVIMVILFLLVPRNRLARRKTVAFAPSARRSTGPLAAPRAMPALHPQPQQLRPAASAATTHPTTVPLVIPGSMYLLNSRYSHLDSYRIGREGEDAVVNTMLSHLDARWTIFRNLCLPDTNDGDIDIVLVGPGGIWAFEVKVYSGDVIVENGRWYVETSNGHRYKMQRGPGAQVRTNAASLCNFLKLNGITYKNSVNRVVVSAGNNNIQVNSTGTHVWTLEKLAEALTNLNKSNTLPKDHIHRIVEVLHHAAESSRNNQPTTTSRQRKYSSH